MEQDNNKFSQDDHAWFDALSGKGDSTQMNQLRQMLIETELADSKLEDTTHDWQRLQFAIRREKGHADSQERNGWRYFAMAASVIIMVGAATLMLKTNDVSNPASIDSATVMRGTSEEIIFSAIPEQDAKQLEIELNKLGVKVIRNSLIEKSELQISLNYPVKVEIRNVLESHIIPVPDQGDLHVVFIKSK
jgi:hypothetical protein